MDTDDLDDTLTLGPLDDAEKVQLQTLRDELGSEIADQLLQNEFENVLQDLYSRREQVKQQLQQ